MGSDYQLNDEGVGGEDFIVTTVMRLNWAKNVDRIGTCKKRISVSGVAHPSHSKLNAQFIPDCSFSIL